MDSKTRNQLEYAKSLFFSLRLVDAYHIFRRYFDRIPFHPEKEHAEYIGLFIRTLSELGKTSELKFYIAALEKHREQLRDPSISYQLAYLYMELPEPRLELARKMFEEILQNPKAYEFHAKAKIMLADYYVDIRKDIGMARLMIDSITEPLDSHLSGLVEIWKAKLLRDEKKFDLAYEKYQFILSALSPQTDWYGYFSARLGLAILYVQTKQYKKAQAIAAEIRELIQGHPFKSVQIQLRNLEKALESHTKMGKLKFTRSPLESKISHSDKSITIKRTSSTGKILDLFMGKDYLDKEDLVKRLYNRPYFPKRDDPLIYYHIYSLRRRLKKIGLTMDVIRNEGKGYRWIPKIESSALSD